MKGITPVAPSSTAETASASGAMPGDRTKAALLPEFQHSGMMVRREERGAVPRLKHGVPRSGRQQSIDPALKAWIDKVIVPAIAEQWATRQASGMVAA
jgi:hypothetical protein